MGTAQRKRLVLMGERNRGVSDSGNDRSLQRKELKMNNIKINERIFKKILITLKDCVAKDNARPALQYIPLKSRRIKSSGIRWTAIVRGESSFPAKSRTRRNLSLISKRYPSKRAQAK